VEQRFQSPQNNSFMLGTPLRRILAHFSFVHFEEDRWAKHLRESIRNCYGGIRFIYGGHHAVRAE
jgi:hypothetical protein